MGQKQTFVRTNFDQNANNGLGEWKALFVTGGNDLAKAFSSAAGKGGLKTMGGVVPMNIEQIGHRIEQLTAKGGHEDTIAQLEHGRTAIEAKLSPKVTAQTTLRVG
ncbi:MAG: hypothetical protein EPN97_05435 [Alphaproteobacteria bacterium]|nr:MAG: hypothetical protein EPN97_05435 [Alphaproteobacteria bacterium]